MTPQDLIRLYPVAVQTLCDNIEAARRLNDKTAAVMPLRDDVIIHNNTFSPTRRESVKVVSTHLHERLDVR